MKNIFNIILVLVLSVSFVYAQKSLTNGIYQDNNKNYNEWKILDNHSLVWNNKAFNANGVRVSFKSLEEKEVTKLFPEDIATINELYANNIKDIIISNGSQLTLSNPQMLNEIIKLLDEKDFTYGIDLSEESTYPLKGFVINPSKYRLDGPYSDNVIVKMWEEVDSGIYVVTSKTDGNILEKGAIAKSANGQVIIRLNRNLTSDNVLMVYPHVVYYNNFDIWQGYNELRDNILDYFKQVKLGKGFRFFYNPFDTKKLTSIADQSSFVPNSPQFSLLFENYLTNNYFHAGSLGNTWGVDNSLNSSNLDTIADYLKLFPMWNNGRGVAFMYSLVTANEIPVDISFSSYWTDISNYKYQSIQGYMSSISEILRRSVADVPVIFSTANASQTYTIPYAKGSADGFSFHYDSSSESINNDMALLYSYAASSPKTTWLVSLNDDDSKPNLISSNFLYGCGYKGFYFDYNKTTDLSKIKEFINADKDLTNYNPTIIEFPVSLPIMAQKIDDNTWWYPSPKNFLTKKFSDNIYAYQLSGSDNVVLFTTGEKTNITVVGASDKESKVVYPKGLKIKKGIKVFGANEYTFEISNKPVIVSNLNLKTLFPKQVAENEINRYEKLIKKTTDDKSVAELMKKNLNNIKDVFKNSAYFNAYGMAAENINKYLAVTGCDIWLEVESFKRTSFSKREIINGASGNAALLLDETKDPVLGAYYASTTIDVSYNQSYTMWIASSNEDISSDFSISYDSGPWIKAERSNKTPYTDQLSWYKSGILNLSAGSHTIDIRVDSINPKTLKYYLALDCILLTQSNYVPKSIVKPDYVITIE